MLKGYLIWQEILQGGGPQPEENPTGTILGNQAIEQEANAYINIKQQIACKQVTDKQLLNVEVID